MCMTASQSPTSIITARSSFCRCSCMLRTHSSSFLFRLSESRWYQVGSGGGSPYTLLKVRISFFGSSSRWSTLLIVFASATAAAAARKLRAITKDGFPVLRPSEAHPPKARPFLGRPHKASPSAAATQDCIPRVIKPPVRPCEKKSAYFKEKIESDSRRIAKRPDDRKGRARVTVIAAAAGSRSRRI